MRMSPSITLCLTSVGIFSWSWYGAAVLNAAALEPALKPLSEDIENWNRKADDAEVRHSRGISAQTTSRSESTWLERSLLEKDLSEQSIELSFAEPAFSVFERAIQNPIRQDQPRVTAAVQEEAVPPSHGQQHGRFVERSLDTNQVKRVVSRSTFEGTLAAQTEGDNSGKTQPSFGGAFSGAAVTATALSSTFTSSVSSLSTNAPAQTKQLTRPGANSAMPLGTPSTGTNLPSLTLPASSASPTDSPILPSAPSNELLTPSSALFSTLSTGVDETYILGPGDIIDVSFFNVPEYSGQHRISTSGTIDLPLIGRTSVNGLTLDQAGLVIAARYQSQLQSPLVSVNVVQQRPVQIAISGEIVQPGLYTVVAQGSDYPRLFQALQQAGGLKQSADLSSVAVRRREASGQQTTIEVDLLALLQDGDISQNVFLQDGDSVLVPSSTELDTNALSQLAGSNLRANSDRPISVAIVGEVTQPGPYQLSSGVGQATVVQALQEAGGITSSANLREIQLRRRTREGGQQTFNINLWELLQNGDVSQDLALQQGDTLTVPTALDLPIEEIASLAASSLSPGTIDINIIGEVESPGQLSVASNTSFNEALLASGGLNRRARQEATLIRFNPNGTVDRQFIDVNLSNDINSETNPLLRPNDVIVVGRSAKAAFDDSVQGLSNTLNLVLPFLFLL